MWFVGLIRRIAAQLIHDPRLARHKAVLGELLKELDDKNQNLPRPATSPEVQSHYDFVEGVVAECQSEFLNATDLVAVRGTVIRVRIALNALTDCATLQRAELKARPREDRLPKRLTELSGTNDALASLSPERLTSQPWRLNKLAQ